MFYVRNNIVGERAKIARLSHEPRLTQEGLAILLQLQGWDIGRSGIAKIEIGLRQVTDIEVVHLARALAVSVAWLLKETRSRE